MFSLEQRQYLEDVLGLNSAGMSMVPHKGEALEAAPAANVQNHRLLVLTYPLNMEESVLLQKILSSVPLGDFAHIEQTEISLADFPEGHRAAEVLAFIDYPVGRNDFDDNVWIVLPPLARMVGANADVISRKKETWNLLQQFAKERT